MAVSKTVNPIIYPLATDDVRLPIGLWVGRTTLAGDVSGGLAEIDIQWTRPAPEVLISVEEIVPAVSAGAAAAVNFELTISTQEAVQEGGFLDFRYILVGNLLGSQVGVPPDQTKVVRYIANPIAGAYQIAMNAANTNGLTYLLSCWGYLWGVAARNKVGGPVRPT